MTPESFTPRQWEALNKLPRVVYYMDKVYNPEVVIKPAMIHIRYRSTWHEDMPLLSFWGGNVHEVVDKMMEALYISAPSLVMES